MEAIKKANENEMVSIIICQEGITPTWGACQKRP